MMSKNHEKFKAIGLEGPKMLHKSIKMISGSLRAASGAQGGSHDAKKSFLQLVGAPWLILCATLTPLGSNWQPKGAKMKYKSGKIDGRIVAKPNAEKMQKQN